MFVEIESMRGVTFAAPTIDSLDASNVAEFKATMRSLANPGDRVGLDLRHVAFLDSAGLGAILSLLRYLGERGGDLVLVSPAPAVESVCDLVRLRQILEIFPTRGEVLDYYGALERLTAGL
jgi:anti-sigma B factor antagonist